MQAARGTPLSADPAPAPPRTTGSRPLVVFATTAVLALLLDQVTKALAVERLQGRPPVEVWGEWLRLTFVRNPGAAFSALPSATVLLSLFAIAAVVVVLVLSRRLGSVLWAFGLGCLLGGALGNLLDRLFRDPGPLRGEVVDFLALPHWPVFNVADICINIAAGVIILQTLRGVPLQGRTAHAPGDDDGAPEREEGSGT